MAYYLLAVTNAGEGMGRIYAGNFGLEIGRVFVLSIKKRSLLRDDLQGENFARYRVSEDVQIDDMWMMLSSYYDKSQQLFLHRSFYPPSLSCTFSIHSPHSLTMIP